MEPELEDYKHRGTGSGLNETVASRPIQHKNTTVGKTVRTFLQACAGAIPVALAALAVNEDFRRYIVDHPEWGWMLFVLPAATAFVTYIQNALDPSVPNTVYDKTVI